jgi:hypothetical protein
MELRQTLAHQYTQKLSADELDDEKRYWEGKGYDDVEVHMEPETNGFRKYIWTATK